MRYTLHVLWSQHYDDRKAATDMHNFKISTWSPCSYHGIVKIRKLLLQFSKFPNTKTTHQDESTSGIFVPWMHLHVPDFTTVVPDFKYCWIVDTWTCIFMDEWSDNEIFTIHIYQYIVHFSIFCTFWQLYSASSVFVDQLTCRLYKEISLPSPRPPSL